MRGNTTSPGRVARPQYNQIQDRLYEQLQVLVGDRDRSNPAEHAVRFKDLEAYSRRLAALEADAMDAGTFLADRVLNIESLFGLIATNVLVANSYDDQEPTTTDSPITVSLGEASGDLGDPVMVDDAGKVTVNTPGFYSLIFLGYASRKGGASNQARLSLRLLINGDQVNYPISATVDNPNTVVPCRILHTGKFSAGSFLTIEMLRSSFGVNRGGLYKQSHPLDWGVSPSASLKVIKHF